MSAVRLPHRLDTDSDLDMDIEYDLTNRPVKLTEEEGKLSDHEQYSTVANPD